MKIKVVSIVKMLMCTALLASHFAHAAMNWIPLSDWDISLDNGVVYVASSSLTTCAYGRAQIDTSTNYAYPSPTYQRDLYAYVMAQKLTGKTLRIVVNDQENTPSNPCKVYGASN